MNINKVNKISQIKVAKYLLIILTPLIIILTNFNYLSLNKNFYAETLSNINTNLSINERIHYTNNVIDYYMGKDILDQRYYSKQAMLHLLDVKNLLSAVSLIQNMSIIVIVILITKIVHEKQYESIFTALAYGCIACLIGIGALTVGLGNYFDQLFLIMHKTVFTNNTWLFSSDDTLIQLFPNEFFVVFANRLAFNIISSSLLLLLISICLVYYFNKHE